VTGKKENNQRVKTIDAQINKLQNRKRKLEEKNKTHIIKIFNRCGANKLPDSILAGGILEIVRAFNQNDERITTWKTEGNQILKPGRGRKKFDA
jgi:hypothetical protein